MIIEILYNQKVIRTIDLPEAADPSKISFAKRVMSKGEKEKEKPHVFHFHRNTGKKFVKDKPQAKIPEKAVVKFERPKAEYSNTQF